MIVSYLLEPNAFSETGLVDEAGAQAARELLKDILAGGVLTDFAEGKLLHRIGGELNKLPIKLGQRLTILLDELRKRAKSLVVKGVCSDAGNPGQTLYQGLADELRPDAFVRSGESRIRLTGSVVDVVVGDYLSSSARKKHETFQSPTTPAADLTENELEEILGGFLKYSRAFTVLDRMFGVSAHQGGTSVRFAGGVKFLWLAWQKHSVFNRDPCQITVVTVAGTMSRGEYAAPADVEAAVQAALESVSVVAKVVLKENTARLFHARFIKTRYGTLKVDPGIDGLDFGGRNCTSLLIDPPCAASNQMAERIMKLPSAM